MSPDEFNRLSGAQSAGFARCAVERSRILNLQAAIAVVAGTSVLFDKAVALYGLAIVGLVLVGFWALLTIRYVDWRGKTERVRRAIIIAGGLGGDIPAAELREMYESVPASEREISAKVDPEYFASKSAPGPMRMSEMLEESVFWTKSLAKCAAIETWLMFGLTLALVVGVLFVSAAYLSREAAMVAIRAACAAVIFLLSTEFFGAAWSYTTASVDLPRIEDRLIANRERGCETSELMRIFGDYNSIVEAMPVFSAGLYPRHRDRLNKLFKAWGSKTPDV